MMYVGIGAFFGAMARFSLSNGINNLNKGNFPFSTFIVNCIGCLFIGLLIPIFQHQSIYLMGSIGFLGAFTTFSTFSLEAIQLIKQKNYKYAFLYVSSTVVIGLLFTYCGMLLSQ